MNYRDTLNLPYTEFPMKADLANREPRILSYWSNINLYKKQRNQFSNYPKFVLHDGPPYANGDIHIGHAINKILKDMILKSRTLSKFNAPYVPGWDCHGLPIEQMVEKKLGKVGIKVSAKDFRSACRAFAQEQIYRQSNDFQRLGVLGDWDNPYLTMDPNFEAQTVRLLAKIVSNGHIYRGYKPVHWCIDCTSSLAEAEVEYHECTTKAIDVLFPVVDPEILANLCNYQYNSSLPVYVVIWTTTPWTLPANRAVSVNPEFEYSIVNTNQAYIIVATKLLDQLIVRCGIKSFEILASITGSQLEGLLLNHPFFDRKIPIILSEYVTSDTGTGMVHTAPAHGQEDYIVGTRYGLIVEDIVGADGTFRPNVPFFAGLQVFKAEKDVIKLLSKHNKLLHSNEIVHSYPHCWRHKTPVIFRATPQWFISMNHNNLRNQVLNEAKKVKFIPDWGKERLRSMIEKRPDWCISRQRYWGIPLTFFVHRDTGDLHPQTVILINKIAELIDNNGIEAWFELDPSTLLNQADMEQYVKSSDIMDVWLESGTTCYSVLGQHQELQYPADLYIEGVDQYRGWFQSSLLTAVSANYCTPYNLVLTHGFTVDNQGKKMSKSLGNVISPQKIFSTLGADVLRLWISATNYKSEINVSEAVIRQTADVYRRLRNTARFLLANLNGFEPKQHIMQFNQMLAIDIWAVNRAYFLQREIISAYEHYLFHVVYQKLINFCSIDMGSTYLEIIKDRQYTTQKYSLARRSAQTAIYYIIEAMTRWLAPILSFTAEEIWQYLPGTHQESVFLTTWFDIPNISYDNHLFTQDYWNKLLILRSIVSKELEKLRVLNTIGSSLDAEVIIYCNKTLSEKLAQISDELRFFLITSYVSIRSILDKPETIDCHTEDDIQIAVQVLPVLHKKCVRCWQRRSDVGMHSEHSTLCSRCITNVFGVGENRKFF